MSREVFKRILFGRHEHVAGTVYGTIVVMGAIAAGSRGDETDAAALASLAGVTVVVLWIAHVYAHGLEESLRQGRPLDAPRLASLAWHHVAILLTALVPVAALCLSPLGVLDETAAVRLALGFGVATLAVQGVRYAALSRLGRLGTAVAVVVNVLLGLVIVVLEASIGH